MTGTFKIYGILAIILALGAAAWGLVQWDNHRLGKAYDAGVAAERAAWEAKAKEAVQEIVSKGNASTRASEATADKARATASTTIAASKAANIAIVEKITHAYEQAPAVVDCGPDRKPQPLPAGVLEGLSEARSAALGGSPATSGGLQPAQRGRPANAPTD